MYTYPMSDAKMSGRAPIQVIKKVWERIAPLKLAETAWDNVRPAVLTGHEIGIPPVIDDGKS